MGMGWDVMMGWAKGRWVSAPVRVVMVRCGRDVVVVVVVAGVIAGVGVGVVVVVAVAVAVAVFSEAGKGVF